MSCLPSKKWHASPTTRGNPPSEIRPRRLLLPCTPSCDGSQEEFLIVFEFTESDRPERFSEPLRSSQAGRLRVRVGLRSRSCDVCAWPGSRRSCDCARRPPIARQPPANARAFRPFPWARLFILFYCNAAFF